MQFYRVNLERNCSPKLTNSRWTMADRLVQMATHEPQPIRKAKNKKSWTELKKIVGGGQPLQIEAKGFIQMISINGVGMDMHVYRLSV